MFGLVKLNVFFFDLGVRKMFYSSTMLEFDHGDEIRF